MRCPRRASPGGLGPKRSRPTRSIKSRMVRTFDRTNQRQITCDVCSPCRARMGAVVGLRDRSGKPSVPIGQRKPGYPKPNHGTTPSLPFEAVRLGQSTIGEIGDRLGRRGLERVTGVAQLDTTLAWYRRLIPSPASSTDPYADHTLLCDCDRTCRAPFRVPEEI